MNKSLYVFLILLSFCYPTSDGICQLNIIPLASSANGFSVNDAYSIQILNPGAPLMAKMTVEISSGRQVYVANTIPFSVITGPNTYQFGSFTIQNSIYSSQPEFEIVKATGQLPHGNFEVCYRLTNLSTQEEVQKCLDIEVNPLTPILLLNPVNGADIHSIYPLFMWLPPTPMASFGTIGYQIKVVEKYPNQSCYEAMERNYEIYKIEDYTTTNVAYPMNAMPLEYNKMYCWQVINPKDRKVDSEIWSFIPSIDSNKIEEKIVFVENYVIPRSSVSGNYINIKNELKIQMGEEFPISEIYFEILNASQMPILINVQEIITKRGNNKFVIDLTNSQLINKQYYTLKVVGKNSKESHFIYFRFYNK